MADISILSRLVNGFQRNVDVSQNSLVVGSLKVGSSSPVEITKAIASKLILIQSVADADGTYDTRYNTKTDLASTAAGEGASLIGVQDAGNFYTATTVEGVLAEIYGMLGSGAAADISYSNTVSGLTATNVQDAIDEVEGRVDTIEANYIPAAQKGAPNGVASLDSNGKVPVSQLPNAIMEYQGMWDASTNTPTLANGAGNADTAIGNVYRVSVAGSVDFGAGSISFEVGDYVILNSSKIWEKADTSDAVTSVNGLTGAVTLTTDNISEGSNLYFTDERAQDAVGSILTDSATIDFDYDDGVGTITAVVKDNSIDEDKLTTSVADQQTITGGNGTALAVQKAPKTASIEVAGESLTASIVYAMRFGRAADAGFVAGRMYKADKDSSSVDNFDVQGLAYTAGVSSGGSFELVQQGDLSAPAHGFTVGEPLWLDSAGLLTQTSPGSTLNEAVVKVGTVKDADTIRVKIEIMSGG